MKGNGMKPYEIRMQELKESPRTWLVSGVAGFIGSNLLLALLRAGQRVVGIDNLTTGHNYNLEEVRGMVNPSQWGKFRWIEGDVTDPDACEVACAGVDVVLHHAALGSVPRSIMHPDMTTHNNVTGFVTLLLKAKDSGIKRFVYASSSAVYGDDPNLPKIESRVGECLSPYAVSKIVNELYAAVFAKCYGIDCIGLRYFNVFGPRQDPNGMYAAVIPRWIDAMLNGGEVAINGDGETSRDFSYVANVVQANILAATVTDPAALNTVYNVAVGGRTTLNDLIRMLRERLLSENSHLKEMSVAYRDFRAGDVRHSNADIGKARRLLGYRPTHEVGAGLDECLDWYIAHAVPA